MLGMFLNGTPNLTALLIAAHDQESWQISRVPIMRCVIFITHALLHSIKRNIYIVSLSLSLVSANLSGFTQACVWAG